MRTNIPSFRLPEKVLNEEVDQVLDLGIKTKFNSEIKSMKKMLEKDYDAIFVGTGAPKGRDINIEGREEADKNVHIGIDWLTSIAFEHTKSIGKKVLVLGGGNTAMDSVRTSLRLGAEKAMLLYRRTRAEMPAREEEIHHAEEEGVEFVWLTAPIAFEGTDHVTGVKVTKMRLGQPDASGRRAPEPDPGSEYSLEADLVIKALGYDPEELPKLFGADDLSVTRWGTLRVDHKTMMTSLDGVFAAGDIVRGASLVVWAIRDGRDVTEHMHRYLKAKAKAASDERVAA